jgi:hypothetical protein
MLSIYIYFLTLGIALRYTLIGFKEIVGAYNGENLIEYIIELLKELEINHKFSVFIGNNVGNIDTAVSVIVRRLRPQEASNLGARRSRYLGHIINLAIKAFIHRADVEA